MNLTCITSVSEWITSRQIHIHVSNFKSISQKTAEKSLENSISTNGSNSCKSQTRSVLFHDKFIYIISRQYLKIRLRKVQKTEWTDIEGTDRHTDRQMVRKDLHCIPIISVAYLCIFNKAFPHTLANVQHMNEVHMKFTVKSKSKVCIVLTE